MYTKIYFEINNALLMHNLAKKETGDKYFNSFCFRFYFYFLHFILFTDYYILL